MALASNEGTHSQRLLSEEHKAHHAWRAIRRRVLLVAHVYCLLSGFVPFAHPAHAVRGFQAEFLPDAA